MNPSHSKHDEAALDNAETASTSSSSFSDATAPPSYSDAVNTRAAANIVSGDFTPTSQLQIQAEGVDFSGALCTPEPVPIPVYRVHPDGPSSSSLDAGTPEYISLRIQRGSNSCALVRGADPKRTPLNATVYRWGPGRPPRIRLLPAHTTASVEEAIKRDDLEFDVVEVKSRSIISRTQKIATPFGTFQWRYSSRSERKETFDANSLLVLELVDATGGKKDKKYTRIAQFVRNEDFRTPGTNKWMAGNGGRLMMDLRTWADGKGADVAKVEAFVVAGCICMLKREVDRARDNAVAAVV